MSVLGRFASSSLWLVLGKGANTLTGFLIFAILARFVTPAELGLVAFAAVFIELSRILVTAGLSDAIIQRPAWSDSDSSTAFHATVLTAVLFAVAASTLGVFLAIRYYSPELGLVLPYLCIGLVIDAVRSVPEAKLQRDFRFKAIAGRTVLANAIAGLIAVVIAARGGGIWALVAQKLASSVLQTLITVAAASWWPRMTFSWAALRSMMGFGGYMIGAQVLGVLNGRVPELAIGAFLGPAAVGYYRVGAHALEAVVQLTINPLQAPALSAFSAVRERDRIGSAYLRLTKTCALVACPVFLGAAAIAGDFIPLVFGEQWQPSAAVMMVMALVVGPATLSYFLQPALAASGRSDFALLSSLGNFFASTFVCAVSAPFGFVAVAFAQLMRAHVSIPLRLMFATKAFGMSTSAAVRGIAAPLLAAVFMAGIVFLMGYFLLDTAERPTRLIVQILVGILLYAAIIYFMARSLLEETVTTVKQVIGLK